MMSAVGDAVHVLPVINALKRHHPGTRITWVLQPGPATLVRGHPSVDEIILFDRAKGWRAFADIRRELAQREFDVVVNLQVYFKAGIVTSFTRAPVKLGFDRARARDFNWLFTNRKIPARSRRQLVLAETERGELFWVEGERIGEIAKVTPRTKWLLEWHWKRC